MTKQFNPRTGARGIQWTDETRNPTGGCMHDCKWEMPDKTIAVCYAKELAENGLARAGYPHGFEHHYWRPSQLRALVAGKEPALIFCDSMSDMFGAAVPDDQVRTILSTMRQALHHTYQSLTKAPKRLLKFLGDFPPNLWVGVSSAPDFFMGKRLNHDQQVRYTRSMLETLRTVKETTGNIVWASLEPLSWDMAELFEEHPLDWVVIGAASNGRKEYQPEPDHVRKMLEVFDATNTPVFFKGNIADTFKHNDFGSERLNRWREDFPVHGGPAGGPAPAVLRRQEMAKEHGWPLNTFLLDAEQQGGAAVLPSGQLALF